MKPLTTPLLLSSLLALSAAAVQAQVINDAAGDFVPTYTGPRNGDVDVLSSFVSYDAGSDTFRFSGTFAGAVGTTAGAFYVWGVDRGVGTERLVTGTPSTGQGVKFDSVVLLRPDGSARVTTFVGAVGTSVDFGVGTATVAGNTISDSIAGSLLGSTGFTKSNYTWNLWPRTGATADTISDFAPDRTNALVIAVPEPATYALMGLGLGAVGLLHRRRRSRA